MHGARRYGLIGSTEFGEDFPDWLQEHVVAYLNVDVSASPFLPPSHRAVERELTVPSCRRLGLAVPARRVAVARRPLAQRQRPGARPGRRGQDARRPVRRRPACRASRERQRCVVLSLGRPLAAGVDADSSRSSRFHRILAASRTRLGQLWHGARQERPRCAPLLSLPRLFAAAAVSAADAPPHSLHVPQQLRRLRLAVQVRRPVVRAPPRHLARARPDGGPTRRRRRAPDQHDRCVSRSLSHEFLCASADALDLVLQLTPSSSASTSTRSPGTRSPPSSTSRRSTPSRTRSRAPRMRSSRTVRTCRRSSRAATSARPRRRRAACAR